MSGWREPRRRDGWTRAVRWPLADDPRGVCVPGRRPEHAAPLERQRQGACLPYPWRPPSLRRSRLRALVGDGARLQERPRVSRQTLTDRSLSGYEDDYLRVARERPWFRAYGAATQEEHRRLGRRLVDLAMRYASAPTAAGDRTSLLDEACQIGEHYGRNGATHGLSASETVEAFMYFRYPVVRSVTALIDEQGLAVKRAVRLYAEINHFSIGCSSRRYRRTRQVEDRRAPLRVSDLRDESLVAGAPSALEICIRQEPFREVCDVRRQQFQRKWRSAVDRGADFQLVGLRQRRSRRSCAWRRVICGVASCCDKAVVVTTASPGAECARCGARSGS